MGRPATPAPGSLTREWLREDDRSDVSPPNRHGLAREVGKGQKQVARLGGGQLKENLAWQMNG